MRELAPTELIPVAAACIRDVLEGCRERFRCVGGGLVGESHSFTVYADQHDFTIQESSSFITKDTESVSSSIAYFPKLV